MVGALFLGKIGVSSPPKWYFSTSTSLVWTIFFVYIVWTLFGHVPVRCWLCWSVPVLTVYPPCDDPHMFVYRGTCWLSWQNTTSWWTMSSCQTKLIYLNPWCLPCTSSPSSVETSTYYTRSEEVFLRPIDTHGSSPLRCSGDFVSSWQIENLLGKNWSDFETWHTLG